MTPSFCLKPKGQTGPTPLYFRLSHQGTRRYVSLGIKVRPEHWNASEKRARSSCPDAELINGYLGDLMEKCRSALRREKIQFQDVDIDRAQARARRIISDYEGPEWEDTGFLSFAEEVLSRYERRGQFGTHKSYQSTLNKFCDFLRHQHGGTTLPFEALTPRLFREFRTYCYEERDNSPNTVGKALRVLRTFVRRAIEAGHLSRDDDPLRHIDFDGEAVDKDVLTPEQIKAIETLELDPDSRLAEHRRWFLWAYHTAGMRFSDVATLRGRHLSGGRVRYRMQKEDKSASIPITERARAILDYYDEIPVTEEGWVFPILEGYGPKESRARYIHKETQNRICNESLREIGRRAGLPTRPTFHLARNAALWRLYKESGDVYAVSKIAGHASVEQTRAYLDAFEDDSHDDLVRAAL